MATSILTRTTQNLGTTNKGGERKYRKVERRKINRSGK